MRLMVRMTVMRAMVVMIVCMMVMLMPRGCPGGMRNIWSVYYSMLILRTHFKLLFILIAAES